MVDFSTAVVCAARDAVEPAGAGLALGAAAQVGAPGGGGSFAHPRGDVLCAEMATPLFSEEEEAEVGSAWGHSETDESILVTLPAGAGGSSIDILGKHFFR